MGKDEIYDYISDKIKEYGNYIVLSYYDVRVRQGISNDELQDFIDDAKDILERKSYKVFLENEKYLCNNCEKTVQSSEIIVAIKEKV